VLRELSVSSEGLGDEDEEKKETHLERLAREGLRVKREIRKMNGPCLRSEKSEGTLLT